MDFLYKLKRLTESFDFDSDNDYELGQPIIDRYKNIQTLEDLISKFVYSHYPNNKNVVTPGVVLDSFIWRFFPYYYSNDDDFIEGISYDAGNKCKMTIIHAGENFERPERKRIKIVFPKKSTRKSFVEECSRKMAEGLIEAGIDMKHINIEKKELSEAFDFNNGSEELGKDIIDRYKNIQILEKLITKNAYLYYTNDNDTTIPPGYFLDHFIARYFPHYFRNKRDFIDCFCRSDGDPDKYTMTIIHGGEDFEEGNEKKRIKIEFPKKKSTRESFIRDISRKIAEGLIDAGIDIEYLAVKNKSELSESFDFNDDFEELGQDIIDRYKTIQILSELFYDYTERAFSSGCTAKPWPISAISKFLNDYFQYYYAPNKANETIWCSGYKWDENFKVFIELVKNDNPISKVKIEIPVIKKKEIDKELFIKEASRKMAEGLVDAGIDMKHSNIMEALSEAFDFNSEPDDEDIALDNTVNKLKRISLLTNRINDSVDYMKERLEEFGDFMMEGESFLDNIIFHLFSFTDDPYEAIDFIRERNVNGGYDYKLFVPLENPYDTSKNKQSSKIYLPFMIDLRKSIISSYIRSIARALVEIDADKSYNLFESFDFDEDLEIEGNIESIKKEHEYRRLCINTFFEFLRKRSRESLEDLLNPSPYSKHIYQEYGINTMNLFRAMFAGPLFTKIIVRTRSLDKKETRLNYSLYYITSNFSFDYKEVELCSFDWDRMMKFDDKEHIKDFFEMFWDEIGTSENALLLGEKLVERNFMVGESFDFDNNEYDLGIDKISTYYKLLEKELDFLLDYHAGPKGRYNVALMLSLLLQRIGLVASEITVSNVTYPKGTIHFRYDETDRNHWKSLISGNRKETKDEIRRMLSDILKDEEVFYDLTEFIKENKLNESFDFDSDDYEQEIHGNVNKIRKFQEWNFENGFKILENFYSLGLKEDPNMKVYAYPSVSLLINILYPIDKSLDRENTREVRVTIGENQSRNKGTILYFRNNKTGKISYKVFPYEYSVKEFKDKWAYLVIEALEEIGASKSNLLRKNQSLYESFDFSNDDEDSIQEKISEISLIRKIIEMFEERAKKTFYEYTNSSELYTMTGYNAYLDKIKDYIEEKTKQWFGIGTAWIKNDWLNPTMEIKVMNCEGEEFIMTGVPCKVTFDKLTNVEFPRFLKAIMDNMPNYKDILMKVF